jgi:AcrR family transcriptional regulator
MGRPSETSQKRRELLPVVARTFAELGYRRTTTADLARRCGVRENVLYRLWRDKKEMFIASIDYVFELSSQTWRGLLKRSNSRQSSARRLLSYEAAHHGELGLHRVIFAGLSETDDLEIKAALGRMYGHFQQFICEQIESHRASRGNRARKDAPSPPEVAWAIIGLGTVASIGRELGHLSDRDQRRMMEQVGQRLLDSADCG